tara:strand:- start:3658 stop:3816 length:159 start_codon:yes stop_codon:yes gene_type:complete
MKEKTTHGKIEILKQRLVEVLIKGKYETLYWTGDPAKPTRPLTKAELKLLNK